MPVIRTIPEVMSAFLMFYLHIDFFRQTQVYIMTGVTEILE